MQLQLRRGKTTAFDHRLKDVQQPDIDVAELSAEGGPGFSHLFNIATKDWTSSSTRQLTAAPLLGCQTAPFLEGSVKLRWMGIPQQVTDLLHGKHRFFQIVATPASSAR